MIARLLCLLLSVATVPAGSAGVIEQAKVGIHRGRYSLDAAVLINADAARVITVVRDPDLLEQVSEVIVGVRILERNGPNHYLRELRMRSCVAFFCFEAAMVEWLRDLPNGVIETELVPEQSDFRFGTSRWTVTETAPGMTRVTLNTVREPKFWIPPVIGPWMFTRTLRRELRVCLERIEELAAAQD